MSLLQMKKDFPDYVKQNKFAMHIYQGDYPSTYLFIVHTRVLCLGTNVAVETKYQRCMTMCTFVVSGDCRLCAHRSLRNQSIDVYARECWWVSCTTRHHSRTNKPFLFLAIFKSLLFYYVFPLKFHVGDYITC